MQVTFKSNIVRTIKSPTVEDVTTYILLVEFSELPSGLSLEINPRKPKMSTTVAKQLIEAVKSPDSGFEINNRGIVIRAKGFKFDSSKSEVTLDLGDDEKQYGILDGGHTYTAIIENRNKVSDASIKKFVKLEILVGENLNVTAVADARNTSVEVSQIALFELDDKFDFIKNAINDQPYKDNVAFKDNDNKPIPVVDLLRLMFAFNIKRYPDDSQPPIASYSGKSTVFKDYKSEYDDPDNIYKKLAPELPKLIELYEKIESELGHKYIEYKVADGIKNPKFGNLRGVNSSATTSEYNQLPLEYTISTGYIMPIFGAFRALLEFNDDSSKVQWKVDPIEMWDKYGVSLVQNTFDTDTNPTQNGKNKTLWQANYRMVDNKQKDLLIEKLKAKGII